MAGSLRAYVLALGPAILAFALPAAAQETMGATAAPRMEAAAAVKSAFSNNAQDWSEAPPANAGRETVAVMIDHAKVVRLPERTQTVVVGNPMIADITVQRNGIVVVTGKSYGVTNVIALDAGGALLAESFIRVQATTESVVIVQRGLERESYSCTPNCQPSILLGDANRYFGEVSGQAGQRNSLATQR